MLYESCGWSPRAPERLWLASGCSRGLLPASPADPSGDPFGRYIAPAFSLQGIFPDPWCAPLGPLTPNLGQKRGHEQLAGDISRYVSEQGSPIIDSTEVAKMKRNP